ncbi:MAG TPA: hypothetical protein VK605_01570 [Solirubrobacteraceae bacterium]|nr:hypothetical protein [Solirubrobacteraceae bacterium]
MAASPDQPVPEPAPQERYGLIALARVRKDDGRSLILYSHDEYRGDAVDASEPPTAGRREPA